MCISCSQCAIRVCYTPIAPAHAFFIKLPLVCSIRTSPPNYTYLGKAPQGEDLEDKLDELGELWREEFGCVCLEIIPLIGTLLSQYHDRQREKAHEQDNCRYFHASDKSCARVIWGERFMFLMKIMSELYPEDKDDLVDPELALPLMETNL